MQNREKHYIAEIIYKSITHTLSDSEEIILNEWLTDKEHFELYQRITNSDYIQSKLAIYQKIDANKIYHSLEKRLVESDKKERRLKIKKILRYAALVIILLGIGVIYNTGYFNSQPQLVFPNEKITLQLENGDVKVINEDGSSTVTNSKGEIVGSQTGTQLVYTDENNQDKLVYNTLTVPYGKRFEIQLSDGTVVNLNAGTSLKYPVKFIKGKQRTVFLKGEAFFNVAKDKTHPFIVNSDGLDVQVLGTQFNMSSYPEDVNSDVVLLEGSVYLTAVKDKGNSAILEPGFKGSINKFSQDKIEKKPVITSIYTAWIDGELVFRNITFKDMLKRMERHYNIEIVNNNSELKEEKFNASFRKEPIEKILEYFKITYGINYEIKDNKILIQ
ncbi:FecR family protein [Aestuariibaculum lutulentum]|uniref:DUF4974 domain-containing protein n=1 Tax=Aestuariibaculum lutulentum TaxID=2920935 RepID=A0ABS9RIA5_9FLAO|nr:FecR domain-containing protein [Aestuariibaculum lutulentum]MCH4552681.1 DUF4974 domain-containing protein [Aestuariibaculum lutulentum]